MQLFDDTKKVLSQLKTEAEKHRVLATRAPVIVSDGGLLFKPKDANLKYWETRDIEIPLVGMDHLRARRVENLLYAIGRFYSVTLDERKSPPVLTLGCKSDEKQSYVEKIGSMNAAILTLEKRLANNWKSFENQDGSKTLEFEVSKNERDAMALKTVVAEHLQLDMPQVELERTISREWQNAGKRINMELLGDELEKRLGLCWVRRDDFGLIIPEPDKKLLETYHGHRVWQSDHVPIGGGSTEPFSQAYIDAAAELHEYHSGKFSIQLQDTPANREFLQKELKVDMEKLITIFEKDFVAQKAETIAKEKADVKSLRVDINKGVLLHGTKLARALCFDKNQKGDATGTLRKLKAKLLLPTDATVEKLHYSNESGHGSYVYAFHVTPLIADEIDGCHRVPLKKDGQDVRTDPSDAACMLKTLAQGHTR